MFQRTGFLFDVCSLHKHNSIYHTLEQCKISLHTNRRQPQFEIELLGLCNLERIKIIMVFIILSYRKDSFMVILIM